MRLITSNKKVSEFVEFFKSFKKFGSNQPLEFFPDFYQILESYTHNVITIYNNAYGVISPVYGEPIRGFNVLYAIWLKSQGCENVYYVYRGLHAYERIYYYYYNFTSQKQLQCIFPIYDDSMEMHISNVHKTKDSYIFVDQWTQCNNITNTDYFINPPSKMFLF